MDPETLEKWKEAFQNERKEYLTKAKDIQKETLQRKKTMEMKAQLEAAKEEKRRQEALAERRAKHVEATMRFQKGLKHFKFNKERISLEQVLRDINPQRNRINSADSPRNHSEKIKKTSSFDSLNESSPQTNTSKRHGKNSAKKATVPLTSAASTLSNQTPKSGGINQQNFNPYNTDFLAENTNLESKKSSVNKTYNGIYISDFKEMLNENQQQIQDHNKVALKEFESLVTSELNGHSTNELSNQNKVNAVNNQNFDSDSDSMDTDSLVNENIVISQYEILGKTSTKSSGNQCDVDEKPSYNFSNPIYYNYYSGNSNKKITDPNAWFKNLDNSELNNQNSQVPNYDSFNAFGNYQSNQHCLNEIYTSNSAFTSLKSTRFQTNKEIKSILKRTSSMDNDLSIVGHSNMSQAVNFGISLNEKNGGVKDSIQLANNRLGKTVKTEENTDKYKKSVRFASNISEANSDVANQIAANNEKANEIQASFLEKTNTTNSSSCSTTSTISPNTLYQRISSTNTTRRPVIKPRTAPIQPQQQYKSPNTTPTILPAKLEVSTPDNVQEKPPAHPNGTVSNGSYALLGQRRKEQTQHRNRLNSPKTTPITSNITPSATVGLQQHLNINYSNTSSPTLNGNGLLLPTNRAPLQSPIQSPSPYFPMPMNSASSTSSNHLMTQNNNNNNNNNSNESNYSNLKYTENNYREYQINKMKFTSSNSAPVTPTINYEKSRPVRTQSGHNIPDHPNQTNDNNTMPQHNLTKIPLSPKSTLKSNNISNQTNENNLIEIIRRPSSLPNNMTSNMTKLHAPIATATAIPSATTAFVSSGASPNNVAPTYSHIPKTNIRFAYLNQTPNNNGTNTLINAQSNRILSAENMTKLTNPNIHLEIKYPLYSNYPQAQYVNLIKPEVTTTTNTTADSLAAFLTAEEMSFKECTTESQILNTVEAIQNLNTRGLPVSLSVEEQNVKNSIIRLNERLNIITNRRLSNTAEEKLNYESLNKYKNNSANKPISANVSAKSRR